MVVARCILLDRDAVEVTFLVAVQACVSTNGLRLLCIRSFLYSMRDGVRIRWELLLVNHGLKDPSHSIRYDDIAVVGHLLACFLGFGKENIGLFVGRVAAGVMQQQKVEIEIGNLRRKATIAWSSETC